MTWTSSPGVPAAKGPKTYLTGDATTGYRHALTNEPVADIVAAMHHPRAVGPDACEEPATMPNARWAEVQGQVGDLALIPDVPMRPAWQSRLNLDPAAGRIFNMHPASMGSNH